MLSDVLAIYYICVLLPPLSYLLSLLLFHVRTILVYLSLSSLSSPVLEALHLLSLAISSHPHHSSSLLVIYHLEVLFPFPPSDLIYAYDLLLFPSSILLPHQFRLFHYLATFFLFYLYFFLSSPYPFAGQGLDGPRLREPPPEPWVGRRTRSNRDPIRPPTRDARVQQPHGARSSLFTPAPDGSSRRRHSCLSLSALSSAQPSFSLSLQPHY